MKLTKSQLKQIIKEELRKNKPEFQEGWSDLPIEDRIIADIARVLEPLFPNSSKIDIYYAAKAAIVAAKEYTKKVNEEADSHVHENSHVHEK